jgi:hypothetical protein
VYTRMTPISQNSRLLGLEPMDWLVLLAGIAFAAVLAAVVAYSFGRCSYRVRPSERKRVAAMARARQAARARGGAVSGAKICRR